MIRIAVFCKDVQTKLADLKTPALLLDLDRMESNLVRMAGYFAGTKAKLRPHFKAHQVLSLASRQVQAGAIGITCARLDHAEALVAEGIPNILIANEIAGENLIRRFVELSRLAPVIVAIDDSRVASDMARMAGNRAGDLNVVVDLDTRLRRGGVPPGEPSLVLAKQVLAKGLKLRGVMGYSGSIRLPSGPEKQNTVHSALQPLVDTQAMLEREGIPVEIVTCGSTSDYSIAAAFPGVTEVQAGSYLLMDTESALSAPEFSPAVSVLATIISKTAGDRFVADAGLKAQSGQRGLPEIKGHADLRIGALHAEHTLVESLDPPVRLDIGDRIEIWCRYLDQTLQLHDRIYGVRNGEVESVLTLAR